MRREKIRKYKVKNIWAVFLVAALLCGSVTGCGNATSDKQTATGYESKFYGDDTQGVYDDAVAETEDYAIEEKSASGDSEYGLAKSVSANDSEEFADSAEEVESVYGNSTEAEIEKEVQTPDKKDSQKIIKRYNYSYETEKFDEAHAYLKQQIEAYNGYVSSSEVYGSDKRTLYLTARIPAEVSDQFVGQLGDLGTIVSQSESAEDITLQYADTESRIASLKTEQERLLALLDKADSLDNIIALENRLTEVRYELENYESQRKLYDDLVSYSTVNITLEEVTYTVPVDDSTFFSRIKTGLEKSFRDIRNGLVNFVVWFIVALPYFVIWGLVIFLIVWVTKKLIRRHKRKKLAKQEKAKKADKEKEVSAEQNGQDDNKTEENVQDDNKTEEDL